VEKCIVASVIGCGEAGRSGWRKRILPSLLMKPQQRSEKA
jgi:hypothetical protein